MQESGGDRVWLKRSSYVQFLEDPVLSGESIGQSLVKPPDSTSLRRVARERDLGGAPRWPYGMNRMMSALRG